MSGNNLVSLRRKPRTADIVADAVAQGRKLPLQVLLESLWRLVDEAEQLESSDNPDDAVVARVARDRALRVAEMAAPYVHPKMASTIISRDEDGGPIRIARDENRFAKLTDAEATRFLEAIARGEMTIGDVDAALS